MGLLTVARDLTRRKARERSGLFVAEGIRTVEELLASPLRISGALTCDLLDRTPRGAALAAALHARDVQVLRALTTRPIKITVPGPFTMAQQASNEYYATDGEMALAYAAVVNEEIRDLFSAGADIVQVDEPYMQARPEQARKIGRAHV